MLVAGTQVGPYRIVSPLGAGGMGEVYLAEDARLGRRIALKLLPAGFAESQERLRRFEQEARAASALNHPNILTIYEIGESDGLHFIATEYIEGRTLRAVLAREKMSVIEALEMAIQVAGALEAAHRAGIVHRDIKPENIMVRPDGYIKLLDFGLVKLTERPPFITDTQAPTLNMETAPGAVMGTVSYMSPEQARGIAVDARTDIFSLGVVIYESVAGSLPFQGPTATDVFVAILEREPVPLVRYSSEVPPELDSIVAKALRKDRDQRYQTSKELLLDLKSLRQEVEFQKRSSHSGVSQDPAASKDLQGALPARPAPVSATPSSASRQMRRRRSSKAINSLAVLPLVNVSNDPNTEYLGDGITESIINSLSQLPRLRVMARSTVFRYKGREVDAQQVGRDLNVRAVLTGRVLQIGDRLVIATELVDTSDGSQLWGEQYNRTPLDIFAVQEEISREISEKLRLKLTGAEKRLLAKRYTDDTVAYQLYLKGRYYTNKRTNEELKKGIDCFNQAIEKDPTYALAYAGLADSYALLGSATGGLPPREVYPKAKAAALKALEIDSALAEAHSSLGFFRLLYDWDWEAAEREFKRAIELNPGYAQAHDGYGFYLKVRGRFREAVEECKKAQELDPLSLFMNISLGWAYYFARLYDEAIKQGQKALDMDSNFGFAYWNMGLAYLQKGMHEEAVAGLRKAVKLSEGGLTFIAHLGHAYAVAGRRNEAEKVIEGLKELSKERYVSSYYIAIIHMGLGDKDLTFEWLEKAYQERAGFLAFLGVEPMFDLVRSDTRFQELLQRVGLKP